MAHQVGDDLDGGAGVGQVLAEGVPQDVGGALLELGVGAVLGEDAWMPRIGQRPALAVQDLGGLLRARWPGAR